MSTTPYVKFELRKKFPNGGFSSHVKPNVSGTGLAVKLCVLITSNFIDFQDIENVVEYNYFPKNGTKVLFGSAAGRDVMVPINPYTKPPEFSREEVNGKRNGDVLAPTNGYSLKFEILPGGALTFKTFVQGVAITKKIYYSDFENKDNLKVVDGVIKYFSLTHFIEEKIIPGDPEPEDPPEETPEKEQEVEVNFIQKAISKMQDFFLKNKWYVTAIYILGLLGLGLWNLPVTIIAFVFGIVGGTYLNK